MTTFIRFMRGRTLADATANAQIDLERGFSFAAYASYETAEAAAESDEIQYYGVDPDTIAEHTDGSWGFALAGLCGYEANRESINDYPYSVNSDFYALYDGEYLCSADQGDGDVFRPISLISVNAL